MDFSKDVANGLVSHGHSFQSTSNMFSWVMEAVKTKLHLQLLFHLSDIPTQNLTPATWDSSLLWRDWASGKHSCRSVWFSWGRCEGGSIGQNLHLGHSTASIYGSAVSLNKSLVWLGHSSGQFLSQQDIQLVPPIDPGKRGSCSGTNTLEALSLVLLWPPSFTKK